MFPSEAAIQQSTHDEGDSHHCERGARNEPSLAGQLCNLNAGLSDDSAGHPGARSGDLAQSHPAKKTRSFCIDPIKTWIVAILILSENTHLETDRAGLAADTLAALGAEREVATRAAMEAILECRDKV